MLWKKRKLCLLCVYLGNAEGTDKLGKFGRIDKALMEYSGNVMENIDKFLAKYLPGQE